MEIPKRLPTLENYLRVDEVGDRVLTPKIVSRKVSGGGSSSDTEVTIEVDGEHYIVSVKMVFNPRKFDLDKRLIYGKAKVDFAHVNIGNELTDFNNALKVVGSVVGTIKHLLEDESWVDEVLSSPAPNDEDRKTIGLHIDELMIVSKAEHTGDDRRNKIYNQFIKKIIPTLGGDIAKQSTMETTETDPNQLEVVVFKNEFELNPPIKVKEGIPKEK